MNTKKSILILSKYFTDNDFMKFLDKKKFKELDKNEALNQRFINFIYFDRGTGILNKNNKSKIYKVKSDYLSALKLNESNFTDKSILNKFVKSKNKRFYEKYFMNQIEYNEKSNNKLNNKKLYITKPIPGYAGLGVKVFNSKEKIKNYIETFKKPNNKKFMKEPEKWIVEEYIENPLLINDKKFHMRVTLLGLCKDGESKIFFHKHALIFPAKHKYNKEKLNMNIHNTHGTLTESHEKMLFPRDFENIFGLVKTKKIKIQIEGLLKGLQLMGAFDFNCYENSKNCFELYGIDIMITDKFQIKCLEINEKPGLERFLKHMPYLIKGLLDVTLLNKEEGEDYIEIEKKKTGIYFYEPNINVSKFIPSGFKLIKDGSIHKHKYIEWIYYNSLLSKKYKKELENIKTNFINWIIPTGKFLLIKEKDTLHELLKKEKPKFFNEYFMNQTVIRNNSNLEKIMKKNRNYILKPIPGSAGFGVKKVNSENEALKHIKNTKFTDKEKRLFKANEIKKWVIQEYISNPLLLKKKKFHLRVLLLNLNRNGNKKLFIFKKFFVYPALKEFNLSSKNKNVHNSHGSKYNEKDLNEFIKEYESSLSESVRDNITKKIMIISKGLKEYMEYKCYPESKNCYQYLGMDIMITDDYKVKCIELNMRPGTVGPSIFDTFWSGLIDLTLLGKSKTEDYVEL